MAISVPSARNLSRSRSAETAAFSLTEVVLAIGIFAFGFVAVLGLLPTGLQLYRESVQTSVSSQIAQRVINEAQQTDYSVLTDESNLPDSVDAFTFQAPKVLAGAFRYFDEQGNEIIPAGDTLSSSEQMRVVYWVNTRIKPRTDRGQATSPISSLATVTVQVANNPGNKALTLGSDNLIVKPAGMSVKTFAVLVSRNT
jgi:uncharacterized protein (TIGR02598 family)